MFLRQPISSFVKKELFLQRVVGRMMLSTSATSNIVVNAVGEDRLGLVADVSKHVTESGGSVSESQAAKLGNHFSVMMLVSIPEVHTSKLEAGLNTIPNVQSSILQTTPGSSFMEASPVGYMGHFMVEGADNPGIVNKVASLFATQGLSVDKMETTAEIAPHGGTCLFRMEGIVTALEPLATGFSVDDIRDELDVLADALNCDISLDDLDEDHDVFEHA